VENYSKVVALWERSLIEEQLDRYSLEQSMTEIIVFGSRSAGVSGVHSDLDVLCVGRTRAKRKTPKLDLICIRSEECLSPEWLGSELGFHVAQYGIWLKGEPWWAKSAFAAPEAVRRKRRRIAKLTENVVSSWAKLHPVFRQRFSTTLRRELQRLDFLLKNVAVPPTPILDRDWTAGVFNCDMLVESAQLRSGAHKLVRLVAMAHSTLPSNVAQNPALQEFAE
jgi:predicted nucleotidyltransferase